MSLARKRFSWLFGRFWDWSQDIVLVIGTIARHLAEDPLTFGVQLVRRLGRKHIRGNLNAVRPTAFNSVRAYLNDQPTQAGLMLRSLSKTRWRRCSLLAYLAILVGQASSFRAAISQSRRLQSVLASTVGDVAAAKNAVAGESSYFASKSRGDWEVLQSHWQLKLPNRSQYYVPVTGRVLFVLTNSLPFTQSGYAHRSQHLLRACLDLGMDVQAVTRLGYPVTTGHIGFPRQTVIDGVVYHRLRTAYLGVAAPERVARAAESLLRLVLQCRPSVLHTTTPYQNAIITRAVAEAVGIPWVYEMRGQQELTWAASRPREYQAHALSSQRVQFQRDKETQMALAADAVVVLSRVQATDLVQRGVAAGKITVVPNAVDQELLEQHLSAANAREQLGLDRSGFWVGSVSSLVDYEGFDTLLQAVALARKADHDIRAAIVGDGVCKPQLMTLAGDLGISDFVEFPGRVSRKQSHRWYRALDVFCVPRKDTPVTRVITPMKPYEAMAVGRPVAVSRLPALMEVIDQGGAGISFEPESVPDMAEALIQLESDVSRYQNLASFGKEKAAMLTWNKDAHLYQALYGQVFSRSIRKGS